MVHFSSDVIKNVVLIHFLRGLAFVAGQFDGRRDPLVWTGNCLMEFQGQIIQGFLDKCGIVTVLHKSLLTTAQRKTL